MITNVNLQDPTLFKFWCQKVLPLVYDDSLSYYEVLCKVVDKINNELIPIMTEQSEAIETLVAEVNSIEQTIDDFSEEFVTKKLKSIALILTGDATIGGNLNVDGGVDLNSGMAVKGVSTFDEKVTMKKDLDVKGDVMIDGYTNLASAELDGDLTVDGALDVGGNAILGKIVGKNNELDISNNGEITISGDGITLDAGNSIVNIDGVRVATINDIPDLSSKLDKTGGTITGNLEVNGNLTEGGIDVALVTDIPDISGKYDKTGGAISGNVSVSGTITDGNTTVGANIVNSPVVTASNYISTPKIVNPNGKSGEAIYVDSKMNITNGVTLGSDSTMNGVKLATLNDIPEVGSGEMSYKGTVGTYGTVTDLPTPSEENKGDVYKVIEDGSYIIKEKGKNIYTTYLEQGTISRGTKTDSNTRIRSNKPLLLESNTQYVISWKPTKNIFRIDLCFYTSGGSYNDIDWNWGIDGGQGRYYFSFNSNNYASVLPYFSNGSNDPILPADVSEIQLEKGSIPTSYEEPTNYLIAYKGDLFIGNVSEWVHVPSGTARTIEHDLTIDGDLSLTNSANITGVNSIIGSEANFNNGSFTDDVTTKDLTVTGDTALKKTDVTGNLTVDNGDISITNSGKISLPSGSTIESGDNNITVKDDDDNGLKINSDGKLDIKSNQEMSINTQDSIDISCDGTLILETTNNAITLDTDDVTIYANNNITLAPDGKAIYKGKEIATIERIPDVSVLFNSEGTITNLSSIQTNYNKIFDALYNNKTIRCNVYINGDNGAGNSYVTLHNHYDSGMCFLCDGVDSEYYSFNIHPYLVENYKWISIYLNRDNATNTFQFAFDLNRDKVVFDDNDNFREVAFRDIQIIN